MALVLETYNYKGSFGQKKIYLRQHVMSILLLTFFKFCGMHSSGVLPSQNNSPMRRAWEDTDHYIFSTCRSKRQNCLVPHFYFQL